MAWGRARLFPGVVALLRRFAKHIGFYAKRPNLGPFGVRLVVQFIAKPVALGHAA